MLNLLEKDPFDGEENKPKYIRIDKYRYKFSRGSSGARGRNNYWDREMIGRVFPRQGVASEDDLKAFVEDWNVES